MGSWSWPSPLIAGWLLVTDWSAAKQANDADFQALAMGVMF
jgi:hypothetical protein